MPTWIRNLVLAGAAAAVLGLVVFVLRPAPVRVTVAPVQRGELQVSVDEEGSTRVRDRFVVTAPIAGRVARITLDAGDPVQQGAVLTHMNPLPLDRRAHAEAQAHLAAVEAQQSAADAQVAQARAALEQAQRSGARAHQLGKKGTISAEELELSELAETARQKELEAATFAARAAAFNVEAARAALLAPGGDTNQQFVSACEEEGEACIELRAPVSGQVLRIPEKSERVVVAGTPLLEIGDTRTLEIVVDVLSTDAVKVRPGAVMWLDDWGGPVPLQARVRLVEPSGYVKVSALGVEEQRVNVIGDLVEPADGLADGYRVEARIVVWEGDGVLKIPSTALFRRGEEWNVFVVENRRARRQAIEIGRRGTTEVQVVRGLDEQMQVILHPSDQIEDGVRVAPL
ncbi:MAG: HlyD family efflux transporter periplasmic adaptor subunit [Deltaproteobacteria bacterium]|nr:HlyD family efflux transporter periplasmic adaptor subunit [Deltaproteobacteria bacterium]